MRLALSSLFLWTLLFSGTLCAQTAEWVWHAEGKPAEGEERFFRRTFNITGKVEKAVLEASCDDQMTVWVNGKEAGTSTAWQKPLKLNVTKELKGGENVLAVRGKNVTGTAALVLVLSLDLEYGKRQVIMTDRDWLSTAETVPDWEKPETKTTGWSNVRLVSKLGAPPWGNVFNVEPAAATPADQIAVPPGFKVELLRSAKPGEGSWVSMAVDPQGRLYISAQQVEKGAKGSIYRASFGVGGKLTEFELMPAPVGAAMGMLWAFDSLYVSGQGPDGTAIYRLRDYDHDDRPETAELFKKVPGGTGEHGAHAIVLGPDRKLYFAHGNSTPLIEGISPHSAMQHYEEESLLPRIGDPVATFFDKLKIPYGQILRADAEGREWELYAAGFRNQYDIDFNPEGELFTYDSDMEWDVGLPWYRATRILQIPSGAEFGFREGTSKWPTYYPDSLPEVVDIGRGSPTGVKFGTRSNFPAQYRRAFFAMDWTYGRILAVHLTPKGAGYEGTFEDFLKGKGMPVSDLEFGPDGAMYFIVGGRGTQAGLYRVSYVGSSDQALPASAASAPKLSLEELRRAAAARALRKRLEAFHGHADVEALDSAWLHLGEDDRFLRFAARVAVESQPVEQWRARALEETDARAGLQALLALARCGSKADQEAILKALARWPIDGLDEPLKLDKLRVIEVSLSRHGRPNDELAALALKKLGAQYPAKSFPLNRELSQLLVFLGAPDAVDKTLALLDTAATQEEQIWYAYALHAYDGTWTPSQRERYFAWFKKAREYRGGNSFAKFLDRIRDLALAKAPESHRTALLELAAGQPAKPAPPPTPPARPFVKAWTMADLTPELDQVSRGRDFARGKEIFTSVQCLQCHHFGNEGGNVGPDLNGVSNRFARRDVLESIIDPGKAISEQYAAFMLTLTAGETVVGQIAEETPERTTLIIDPVAGTRREIPKKEIKAKEASPISLMPPGLLNILTKEEIFDLLAYIESSGNSAAPQFKK